MQNIQNSTPHSNSNLKVGGEEGGNWEGGDGRGRAGVDEVQRCGNCQRTGHMSITSTHEAWKGGDPWPLVPSDSEEEEEVEEEVVEEQAEKEEDQGTEEEAEEEEQATEEAEDEDREEEVNRAKSERRKVKQV
jgi:hypothetical protein